MYNPPWIFAIHSRSFCGNASAARSGASSDGTGKSYMLAPISSSQPMNTPLMRVDSVRVHRMPIITVGFSPRVWNTMRGAVVSGESARRQAPM